MVVPDGRGGTTHDLPTGGPLTKALRDAGFDLSLSTHEREGVLRYLPTRVDDASSFSRRAGGGSRRVRVR